MITSTCRKLKRVFSVHLNASVTKVTTIAVFSKQSACVRHDYDAGNRIKRVESVRLFYEYPTDVVLLVGLTGSRVASQR